MNGYLVFILFMLIGEYVLESAVRFLNLKSASPALPNEFFSFYDAEKYALSQKYLRETSVFGFVKDTIFLSVILTLILSGFFNYADKFVRNLNAWYVVRGLMYAGAFFLIFEVLSIPFSAYRIFHIEEKYNFNKTTPGVFASDIVKSFALSAVIGGIMLSVIIWCFTSFGRWATLYCWIVITVLQLFITFIAPIVILPIFNKFTPLEEGGLKTAINEYAEKENFRISGIFKMDASKRSTKSNAFFTGFGRFRRIALFDTLIKKHSTDELVSILAHEIGHYKKGHIVKNVLLSITGTGVMFFVFSFFVHNEGLFAAFKIEEGSIYASIILFSFLYIPIHSVISVISNYLSRRYEYEADAYVVSTYSNKEAIIKALKRLTVDNLINLTPHPAKVFLHYSHPPVLKRIEAIRRMKGPVDKAAERKT